MNDIHHRQWELLLEERSLWDGKGRHQSKCQDRVALLTGDTPKDDSQALSHSNDGCDGIRSPL